MLTGPLRPLHCLFTTQAGHFLFPWLRHAFCLRESWALQEKPVWGLPQFPLCAAVSAAWPPSCSLFFASLPRLAIIAGRPFWSHASGWAMKYSVLAQETPPQPTPPILPRSGYRHEGWQGRRTLTSEHTEEKAKLRYCTSPADKKPDGTELKGRWPWSN